MAKDRTAVAVTVMIVGVVLPFLVWFGGKEWLALKAPLDRAPDQGAMVLVYLGFWASVGVGLALNAVGLLLLRTRPPDDRRPI